MIHSIYYKINEFHAKFSLLEQILLLNNKELIADEFQIRKNFGDAAPIIHEHLHCLQKAKNKLPAWVDAGCIFCKIPYEQSTSQYVAEFHAKKFSAKKILSLTGGLGADDVAFALAGSTVTSLDPDINLNALFNYNLAKLGISNVNRLGITAEDFLLSNLEIFDLIYADPDRRPDGQRTHRNVHLYSPDIFKLIGEYRNVANEWLIKLSPMTDVQWLLNVEGITMDIFIVQQENEVKEVLCHVSHLSSNKISLVVADSEVYREISTIKTITETEFNVFVEPTAAVIKSGLNKTIQITTNLKARNSNFTYFTGNCTLDPDLARNFTLITEFSGSISQMLVQIQSLGIDTANISTRDFILKTEDLRKKLGLKDGGEHYLFFTGKKEKTCFICKKLILSFQN